MMSSWRHPYELWQALKYDIIRAGIDQNNFGWKTFDFKAFANFELIPLAYTQLKIWTHISQHVW